MLRCNQSSRRHFLPAFEEKLHATDSRPRSRITICYDEQPFRLSNLWPELKVGDTAPDFTMVGSDGKTYKLSELNKQGKAVVVAWFPRAFTGGCTKECTSFKNDGAKMRDYDVAYFTASNDPLGEE